MVGKRVNQPHATHTDNDYRFGSCFIDVSHQRLSLHNRKIKRNIEFHRMHKWAMQ